MRVGFIWHCPYPWDVRLQKMIRACVQAGHEVSVVCHHGQGLEAKGEVDGATIWRVTAPGPQVFSRMTAYPLFFNPLWIAKALSVFSHPRLHILIVRDLPLAYLAGQIGKKLGIPVMMDMAENYPAALIAYQRAAYKPLLFGDGWLPRQYERVSLACMNHVLVVTEEQRARLEALSIPCRRISLVRNTPEPSFYESFRTDGGRRRNGRIELLYMGKLDPHRGVDTVIRAMPDLARECSPIRLTLVGDGRERASLAKLAQSQGVKEALRITGWLDLNEIPRYIRESTICLIPHRRSEHTETTLPNKLFEYMAFAKPIAASDCGPLRRIIDAGNCGRTFTSGNPADCARTLAEMIRDPRLEERGSNGRKLMELKYTWTMDRKVFLDVLEQVREKST